MADGVYGKFMKFKVLVPVGESNNVIATIAIGNSYYDDWYRNAYPSWKRYCIKHDLGLLVITDDLISKEDTVWKKPTWQKMLIPNEIHKFYPGIQNVCYLDTDILINHYSPNIFDCYDSENIGLVSLVKNIPLDRDVFNKRLSFLRHTFYDNKYLLDSAALMSVSELFSHHDLTPQDNFACMGLIVFNINNHKDIMAEWFNKYDSNIESITEGGDQTHINYEIQNWGKITWLDYKFQALWNYEIAIKYPFLYSYGRYNNRLIRECIEASLIDNYFLHFAGSWYESDMWKLGDVFGNNEKNLIIKDYYNYLNNHVEADPKGMIRPR